MGADAAGKCFSVTLLSCLKDENLRVLLTQCEVSDLYLSSEPESMPQQKSLSHPRHRLAWPTQTRTHTSSPWSWRNDLQSHSDKARSHSDAGRIRSATQRAGINEDSSLGMKARAGRISALATLRALPESHRKMGVSAWFQRCPKPKTGQGQDGGSSPARPNAVAPPPSPLDVSGEPALSCFHVQELCKVSGNVQGNDMQAEEVVLDGLR